MVSHCAAKHCTTSTQLFWRAVDERASDISATRKRGAEWKIRIARELTHTLATAPYQYQLVNPVESAVADTLAPASGASIYRLGLAPAHGFLYVNYDATGALLAARLRNRIPSDIDVEATSDVSPTGLALFRIALSGTESPSLHFLETARSCGSSKIDGAIENFLDNQPTATNFCEYVARWNALRKPARGTGTNNPNALMGRFIRTSAPRLDGAGFALHIAAAEGVLVGASWYCGERRRIAGTVWEGGVAVRIPYAVHRVVHGPDAELRTADGKKIETITRYRTPIPSQSHTPNVRNIALEWIAAANMNLPAHEPTPQFEVD